MTQSANRLLLAYFQSRPFAIAKSRLREVIECAHARATTMSGMTPAQIDAAVQAASMAPLGQMVGSTAIIPVTGCITQKSDFYSWYFGGTSIERLTASFRQYVNDQAVSTIVFNVDSPGGEVYGVPEFFEEAIAARGQKKLIAIANPFMASAAYWISCAAEEIWQLPSGQSGSVGCYTMHEDLSKMLEQIGVDITFIQYGEHKTDGNPYEPLSESSREELQEGVNYYGQLFDKGVAAGRSVKGRTVTMADVKAKFGQGRVFRAPDAKKIGMVDQIGTLDKLMAKLAPARMRNVASASRLTIAAAADDDTIEPNDDGEATKDAEKATAEREAAEAAQLRADEDEIAITLALSEN